MLVDDIVSTGRTMIAAVEHLREQRSAPPVCVAVHAVFAGSAFDDLARAGAARVVTTNTIPHASNVVDVVPAIADAVRRHLAPAREPPTETQAPVAVPPRPMR